MLRVSELPNICQVKSVVYCSLINEMQAVRPFNIYYVYVYVYIYIYIGFPGGSAGKEYTCNVGDLGLIPGLGRSPRERNGYRFHIV